MIKNQRIGHPALFLVMGCIGCTVSTLLSLPSAIAFEDVEKAPGKPASPTERPAHRKRRTIKTVAGSAYYKGYDSLQPMEDAADVVVIGVPTEDFLDRRHLVHYLPDGLVSGSTTETTVRITRIIKAQNRNQLLRDGTVTFIEPIGLYEQGEDRVKFKYEEDYNELKQGKTYLLFLKRSGSGSLGVINMNEGKFNMDGTDPDDDPAASRGPLSLTEDGKAMPTRKQALRSEILKRYRRFLK